MGGGAYGVGVCRIETVFGVTVRPRAQRSRWHAQPLCDEIVLVVSIVVVCLPHCARSPVSYHWECVLTVRRATTVNGQVCLHAENASFVSFDFERCSAATSVVWSQIRSSSRVELASTPPEDVFS